MPPPFERLTPAELGLLGFGALGVLAAALPALASCLGLSFLRYSSVEDPALAGRPTDPGFEELAAQLWKLGFEPAGVIREQCWLFQHHWYKSFVMYSFRSRDGLTYATLYRIVPAERWRVSLETLTDTGAMVRTVTPGTGIVGGGRLFSRREVLRCDPAELLECHSQHLHQYLLANGGAAAEASLAERAAADERIEREQVARLGGLHVFLWLALFLLLPGCLAVEVVKDRAPGCSPATAYGGGAIAGCLVYLAWAWYGIPALVLAAAREQNPD